MFCPKCGNPMDDGDSFCRKCGFNIPSTANISNTPQTTTTKPPKGASKYIIGGVLLAIILIGSIFALCRADEKPLPPELPYGVEWGSTCTQIAESDPHIEKPKKQVKVNHYYSDSRLHISYFGIESFDISNIYFNVTYHYSHSADSGLQSINLDSVPMTLHEVTNLEKGLVAYYSSACNSSPIIETYDTITRYSWITETSNIMLEVWDKTFISIYLKDKDAN